MKTTTIERAVITNTSERSEFKATNTAKIFHMLISGLYSNKPQSITREIWSNAYDAHVEVGTPDKQFDVTLPTLFNLTFTVRDYGPSMTHETIMDMYTNLGESTKEDSNDGVGKWGIGSKSPFSYTDTFSVTAYLDGEVRHYSAVIEAGGIPAMYCLAKTKTDQPNGIEISFPVDTNDVRAFRKAAQRVSYGFDVKPNVVGMDEGEEFEGWIDPPVINEGEDWKLLNGPLEGYGGTAYAKMGCVLYPIDVESVEGLTDEQRQLLSATLIIEFPIGDLEITPSRESLQYGSHDPTTESIRERIVIIFDNIADKIVEDYVSCDTYWEACQKFVQHLNLGLPDVIKNMIRSKATWRGEELANVINLRPLGIGMKHRAAAFCEISGKKLQNKCVKYVWSQTSTSVEPAKNTVVIVEDLSLTGKEKVKRVAPRIKLYTNLNPHVGQVLWVKYRNRGKDEAEHLLWLMDKLDGATVIDVADLDAPSLTAAESMRKVVPVRLVKRNYSRKPFEDIVDLTPEDFDKGGYYVKISRLESVQPYGCAVPYDMVNTLRRVNALPNVPVYAISKALWKKFEGPQWKEIYAVADEYIAEAASAESLHESKAVSDGLCNFVLQFADKTIACDKIGQKSEAASAINFFKNLLTIDTSESTQIRDVIKAMNKESEFHLEGKSQLEIELDYHVEMLQELYPLLELLARQCVHEDDLVDKVTNYIYMCDMAQENQRTETKAA